MLRRSLVPVFVVGALALGGCGSSSSSGTGGAGGSTGGSGGSTGGSGGSTGGSGGSTGGSGGSTGGSGGSTGGAGGATGGSGGATGGSGGATGGAGGAGGAPNLGCGTSANTCTKAETDAQNACLASKCASAYQTCLGAGFLSGTFGGVCGTWFKCVSDCGCGNFTCVGACGQPSAECQTCLLTANQCQTSMCPQPACYGTKPDAGTTNPGTDGGAGGSCADLTSCCAMIADAAQKSACTTVAGLGQDATCSQTLQAFKGTGACH